MWYHYLDFGTVTGKIDEDQTHNLKFQTSAGGTLSLSDFKGKYLLLECWYTHCGVCYKKMPEVQKLYDTYKNDDRIAIFALHSRIIKEEEKTETGAKILEKRSYTYPCLSIDINNPILKDLGVNSYPTVLIFDKESNLIFRGSIEYASNYIKDKLSS